MNRGMKPFDERRGKLYERLEIPVERTSFRSLFVAGERWLAVES